MKIYVVAGQHGTERFGLKVIGKIQQQEAVHIKTRIGHPEAIAKGVRYLEHDLNRSYGNCSSCLESKVAENIRRELIEYTPDVVLDLHTSISDVGDIAIVAGINHTIQQLAAYFGMDAIVKMPRNLTETSLIGCLPHNSLALEFGRYRRSDKLAQQIANKIQQLDNINIQLALPPVFEVFTEIDKNFDGLTGIKNLQFNKRLNGYPFLAGPNTYETIGGFLARKL